jgi:hypothetical protein
MFVVGFALMLFVVVAQTLRLADTMQTVTGTLHLSQLFYEIAAIISYPLIEGGILLYAVGRLIDVSKTRRWIDSHITAIGVWSFVLGLLLLILGRVRVLSDIATMASDGGVAWPGFLMQGLAGLGGALFQSSVLLIAVGVLVKNWPRARAAAETSAAVS